MNDRRVHAEGRHGQVVRYDRAGKWYLEFRDGWRQRLTIAEAVTFARAYAARGGTVHLGLPGGQRFDRLYDA